MSNEHIWTTKDNRKIPVSKMVDKHLLNSLRMCQRMIVEEREMLIWGSHPVFGPRGDGAQMAFEKELEDMVNMAMIARYWIPILKKEVEKRNLSPLKVKSPDLPPKIKSVQTVAGAALIEFDKGD